MYSQAVQGKSSVGVLLSHCNKKPALVLAGDLHKVLQKLKINEESIVKIIVPDFEGKAELVFRTKDAEDFALGAFNDVQKLATITEINDLIDNPKDLMVEKITSDCYLKKIKRTIYIFNGEVLTKAEDIQGEDTCEEPEDTCEEPEDTCEEPKDTCEEPKDTCEEPEDTCEEPKDTCEEPKDTCEEPKDKCEEPKDTCEEPKDTCEEPKDTCEEPKDKCGEPNCQTSSQSSESTYLKPSIIETKPTNEQKPTHVPKPTTEQKPTNEQKPTHEPKPRTEQKPTNEQKPTHEPKPRTEQKPTTNEQKPTHEPKPRTEEKPTTELKPDLCKRSSQSETDQAAPMESEPGLPEADEAEVEEGVTLDKKTSTLATNPCNCPETFTYVVDSFVGTETRHCEFKQAGFINNAPKLKQTIGKYVCGFLNSGGGILFLGVNDEGRVTGLELTLEEISKIRYNITSTIKDIKPVVSDDEYSINFANVLGVESKFLVRVVEVCVKPRGPPETMYSYNNHIYIRMDGSIRTIWDPASLGIALGFETDEI